MPAANSKELFALVERGESHAASVVFDRYVERLIALVRKRIGPKLARRIDPEDVVQSTYRSFFAHAENEEYQVAKSGDLWRLLASIALHKLYGQIEKHTAARRNIGREEAADNLPYPDLATRDPGAAEVVAVTEQLQLINKRLTAAQRDVLTRYLQGDSVDAIAANLQKAPRTIRRVLAECREEFERQLLPNPGHRDLIDEQTRRDLNARAPLKYTDYVLERLIGAGGMGKVYRAKNRHTGEQVAIKTLHKASQRDRRVVEKFLQEADILARLAHPNIVKFHGVGRFPGGGYFLVMDFIDGTDLQTRLDRFGPFSELEATRIIRDVATAIAHSHAHGIVHGDLKPANVILDQANHVIVTDFGLAQFITEPGKLALLIGGTAGYTAPEVHIAGKPPTPTADIYSLGALLFALLTGKPPVNIGTTRIAATIDPKLSAVLAECLENDPAARFQKARQLVEAIQCL